jgi:hypothetical protein
MCQNPTASLQQDFLVILAAFVAIKDRIVTSEAINSDPTAKRSLSEDEVPRRLWIKVLHSNRQDTKSIGGKIPPEDSQNIAG